MSGCKCAGYDVVVTTYDALKMLANINYTFILFYFLLLGNCAEDL